MARAALTLITGSAVLLLALAVPAVAASTPAASSLPFGVAGPVGIGAVVVGVGGLLAGVVRRSRARVGRPRVEETVPARVAAVESAGAGSRAA